MGKLGQALAGVAILVTSFLIPGTQGWLTNIGLSVLAGGLAMALASQPRQKFKPQLDVQYAGTVEPRRFLYGMQKVSGMHIIPPWTSGEGNKFVHQDLALFGHECSDITDVYFNQDVIADADIGAVTGTIDDGKVNSGTYAGRANIRRYLGTAAQTADFILKTAFPSQWTSAHKGVGITHIALQHEIDDKDHEVYKGSIPIVSCIVKGKIVYDPRLDIAPGDDPTNTDYRAYSTNPALCLADYLIDETIGCKIPSAKIDWDLVVAAANICDEEVIVPPVASPTNTQSRYTCNVAGFVATSEAQRRDNIETLVSAMMGYCYFRQGKYRMGAGAAGSSSFALTDSDLVGRVTMATDTPAEQKYNYVRGQFVDAARNYQLLEFEPQVNATYEADDGERMPREADFGACTNQYEAQRDAMIMLKRSRRKLSITGIFAMSAFKLRPGDVGTLTLEEWGLDQQAVRCMSWKFLPNFTCEVSFLEEDAADFDDPSISDYIAPASGTGPTSGQFTPGEALSFTATPMVDNILFQWEWPAIVRYPMGFNLYEAAEGSPLPNFDDAAIIKGRIYADGFLLPKADTTHRRYWLTTFQGPSSNEGLPAPSVGLGIVGYALSVTTGFRLTVDRGSHVKTLVGTGSGTTANTSTVTPIAGTPTYTYSWVRTSGSTKISVVSASSATTGFSGAGITEGDGDLNAIFTCTVTDFASPHQVATITVSVTFRRDDSFGS